MIQGLKELNLKLVKLEAFAEHAALEVAGAKLVDLTAERFTTETDPYGTAWKKSRRALRQGGQTLSQSGALRRSFSHVVISADTLAYGTNDIKAKTHQYGRTIRMTAKQKRRFHVDEVKIPAREMIPERGDPGAYDQALIEALEDGAKAAIR
jgi:phage gpG-like protein